IGETCDGFLTSGFDLDVFDDKDIPTFGVYFDDYAPMADSIQAALVSIIINRRSLYDNVPLHNLARTILISGHETPLTQRPIDAFDELYKEGAESAKEFFNAIEDDDDSHL
ncbi:MAG: hypothetical protein WA151_13895, partial [Desulfatirhabdiaceae bacterium]